MILSIGSKSFLILRKVKKKGFKPTKVPRFHSLAEDLLYRLIPSIHSLRAGSPTTKGRQFIIVGYIENWYIAI
jgi:hypothetical protein